MRKIKFRLSVKHGIFVCLFTLIISTAGITTYDSSKDTTDNIKMVKKIGIEKVDFIKLSSVPVKETEEARQSQEFTITAYDLSVQSCGKSRSSPSFGVTSDGTHLSSQTWETARTISTDPKIIPIGSSVKLEFKDERYKKYDGIYTARDSGSAIKGAKIDLFLGDFYSSKPSQEAIDFGKTMASVTLLN